MASSVASDLAGMSGGVNPPVNTGKVVAGRVQKAPGGPSGAPLSQRAPTPQARPGAPPGAPKRVPQRPQIQQRPYSANNPPMGTAPPPIPRPGLIPPYPDARSPQPTLMPNGVPIMPPPPGFPLAGAIPRVPPTFAPGVKPMGMTALLGR
jgi:hypothetical protein